MYAQLTHLRFRPITEILHVRETEARPKFSDTSGDKVSVLVEIGRGGKRLHVRAAESLKVERLPSIDFLQNSAHLASVALFQGIEPGERSGQRID